MTNSRPDDGTESDFTAGARPVASSLADDAARIKKIAGRLGAERMPQEDTGTVSTDSPAGSAPAGGANEPAVGSDYQGPTGGELRDQFGSDPAVDRFGSDQVGSGDDVHVEAARDYLEGTGRYEDVDGMSLTEIREALADEAARAAIGYEGPVSGETALGWALAEQQAAERDQLRQYLVDNGYDEAEVNAMSDEQLAATINAEVEAALHGAEPGIGRGETVVRTTDDGLTEITQEGTSLRLGNVGGFHLPGAGGEGEAERGGESPPAEPGGQQPAEQPSGSGSQGSGAGSDAGGGSDSDDSDSDGSGSESTEDSAVPSGTDDSGEDDDAGGTADPAASTPAPDHVDEDPAARRAFLESEAGAGQRAMDEHAIEMARGGGLLDGGSDFAARHAWFGNRMSAEERETQETGIEMARSGGHTDPVEFRTGSSGLSDLDELRVTGGGYTDPVDDAGGGGALPPAFGTGAPGPVVASGVRSLDFGAGAADVDAPRDGADAPDSGAVAGVARPVAATQADDLFDGIGDSALRSDLLADNVRGAEIAERVDAVEDLGGV